MKDLHRLWSLEKWSRITVTIYLITTISSKVFAQSHARAKRRRPVSKGQVSL